MERAGALEFAIDIIAEGFSVVDGGDAIPLAEGMEQLAIEKGTALAVGGGEAVKAPLAVDDADLKEHAVGSIVAGGWIDLLKVEEALGLGAAGIGAKDDLPGEGGCSGEWMHGNEERIVDAVEFDGLAVGRVDEVGMAKDGCGMAADGVELVESPESGLPLGGGGRDAL